MFGTGVRPAQPTSEERRKKAQAELRVQEIERRPNSKKIAEELAKAKALEDYAIWARQTNHGRYLPRNLLPHANMSRSEAQLRAAGVTGRHSDTVLRGNSEGFAESIYRARGPEAMKVRREAVEAMQKMPQFTQMPQGVKEQIEERKRLLQEKNQQAENSEKRSPMPPLRITAENIYWGQHVPSKPKEIIWESEFFDRLPRDQQKNIYTLSNSIHSGNANVVKINEYKIALDNLIRLDPQTLNTLETLEYRQVELDTINTIKGYWNRFNHFDYSIEPDEIYFFILDWISKNTVYTEEPYVIFNKFLSDRIRSILEESRIPNPQPNPYPEFNQKKRELIIRLYYYPDLDAQEILNSFMDEEEQNRFKPRLMRELNLRETKSNEIYGLVQISGFLYTNDVIEDCRGLWYQLNRITQRMHKLYPMYRDAEVYPANQSRSIIDSLVQKRLFRRFIRREGLPLPAGFNSTTQEIKNLAIIYRTIEFEFFEAIKNLHKKPEIEKLKGGSKTRKNKRKQ